MKTTGKQSQNQNILDKLKHVREKEEILSQELE